MIADLIILAIPVITLWNLQLSKKRKIGVIAIVGFGASAVIVAGCRMISLYHLHVDADVSYEIGRTLMLAALEIQLAIVAVNLPSMKALWSKITGEESNDSGDTSGGYKLSSFNKRAGPKSKSGSKQVAAQTSVTGVKLGGQFNGSEDSLFNHVDQIKVTTKVDVTSSEKSLNESQTGVSGISMFSKE